MRQRFSLQAALLVVVMSVMINAAGLTYAHLHDYAGVALNVAFALLMLCNLPAVPLIALVPAFTGVPEQGVAEHPMFTGVLWTLGVAGPGLNAIIVGFVWPALKRY